MLKVNESAWHAPKLPTHLILFDCWSTLSSSWIGSALTLMFTTHHNNWPLSDGWMAVKTYKTRATWLGRLPRQCLGIYTEVHLNSFDSNVSVSFLRHRHNSEKSCDYLIRIYLTYLCKVAFKLGVECRMKNIHSNLFAQVSTVIHVFLQVCDTDILWKSTPWGVSIRILTPYVYISIYSLHTKHQTNVVLPQTFSRLSLLI